MFVVLWSGYPYGCNRYEIFVQEAHADNSMSS